jgi:hypothetical protein
MVFRAARMLNLDLDGQCVDILELALYNTALAGLGLDGERYFTAATRAGPDTAARAAR